MSWAKISLMSVFTVISLQSCDNLSLPERHHIDTSILPGEYVGDLQFVINQVDYQDKGHVLTIAQGESDFWYMSFDSIQGQDSVYVIADIRFKIDQYKYLDILQSANIIVFSKQEFSGIATLSNWDPTNTLHLNYRSAQGEIRYNIGIESVADTAEGISLIRINASGFF